MRQKGFTIIEVTVVGVISVLLLSALFGLQQIAGENQSIISRHTNEVEIANSNMSTMVKEIRNAHYGDNGAFLVESANTQSLIFYSDINLDGDTEKIRYFLDGTLLKKGVIQPQGFPVTYPANTEVVTIVAEDVRNGELPLFYYYNDQWPIVSAGNPLPVPADQDSISLIRVHLRVNQEDNDTQGDYVLESFAQIRTVKDNL
jgi:type II secretory pathway pseudopilin PulG